MKFREVIRMLEQDGCVLVRRAAVDRLHRPSPQANWMSAA